MTRAVLPLSFSFLYDNNIIFAKEQASQNFCRGDSRIAYRIREIPLSSLCWGREKKKHSKYFWKILWAFPPQNSPYPSFTTIPTPVFSPNCGQKSTRKENFFQNFQKLFSSQTLVFCLFQNFFPCKCRPRHTFSRWKSTKNGQPAQPEIPKDHPCLDTFPMQKKNSKKYSKKSKKFQKRGWHFRTGVLYYMSARNESGKNNGPWKLNNKLRERNKDLVNNFEHKVLK